MTKHSSGDQQSSAGCSRTKSLACDMLLTGKPVCNVSTFAMASVRFDLNLFKSKPAGLGTVIVPGELALSRSSTAVSAPRLISTVSVMVLPLRMTFLPAGISGSRRLLLRRQPFLYAASPIKHLAPHARTGWSGAKHVPTVKRPLVPAELGGAFFSC